MIFLSDLYKMPHISYIILNIIILILTIILCGKGFLKGKQLIIKIAGIILFVLVIVNRFSITIKNSIFPNSLIFQGLSPIKYQNLMYFPLFLPL